MSRRGALLAAAVAIAAAIGVYLAFFRSSDEQKIREAVARAAAAVHTTEDDTNPLTRMAHVKSAFKECVDKDVRVSVQEVQGVPGHLTGRDSLANATAQALGMFQRAEVDVSAVDVKLDDARRSAQVKATGTFEGIERGGRSRRERRDLSFLVIKTDDGWRISTITVWPPARD